MSRRRHLTLWSVAALLGAMPWALLTVHAVGRATAGGDPWFTDAPVLDTPVLLVLGCWVWLLSGARGGLVAATLTMLLMAGAYGTATVLEGITSGLGWLLLAATLLTLTATIAGALPGTRASYRGAQRNL